MSLQERRQDASASKGIEGFAYNRQILKWNPRGFEAQPVIRKKQSAILRTVLNYGPLTVDEIRTKNGDIRFRFTARTMKPATEKDMRKIILMLRKALTPDGILPERKYWIEFHEESKAAKRAKYAENKDAINKKRREDWAANRDAISAKRKIKYAERKALKAAMQNLPTQAC